MVLLDTVVLYMYMYVCQASRVRRSTACSEDLIRDGLGKEYKPKDYLEAFARFVQEKPSQSPAGRGYLGGDRWRCFSLAEVEARDFKLDSFKWLKDDSLEDADELPPPEELATDAISELGGGRRGVERRAGAAGEW